MAIVSLKAPRKLKVCHFKKGTEICNYSYSNTILAVKLNRQVSNNCSENKRACRAYSSSFSAGSEVALSGQGLIKQLSRFSHQRANEMLKNFVCF